MVASRDRGRKQDERTCPGASKETARAACGGGVGRGGQRSHRHIMSSDFFPSPAIALLCLPSPTPLHIIEPKRESRAQTPTCLSVKMPRRFNNISCPLRFQPRRGEFIPPSDKTQTVISDKRNGKGRVRPIRFNHVWRNVILEDTRAERLDVDISYYAKRRVLNLRI